MFIWTTLVVGISCVANWSTLSYENSWIIDRTTFDTRKHENIKLFLWEKFSPFNNVMNGTYNNDFEIPFIFNENIKETDIGIFSFLHILNLPGNVIYCIWVAVYQVLRKSEENFHFHALPFGPF